MFKAKRLAVGMSVPVVVGMIALFGPLSAVAADMADWQTYSNWRARLTFKYPSDWVVGDVDFYETAGGAKATEVSLTLYQQERYEDSENWIRLNPRQFQDDDGQCVEAVGNQICTYSRDAGVLEVYRRVAATMKALKLKDGAYTPPPGSKERKAILDALREELKGLSISDVVFVVDYLAVHEGWAWISTSPESADGTNRYESVTGLLENVKGRWKVRYTIPCCGECEDDPDCADPSRWRAKLKRDFPSAPLAIILDE